MRTAKEIIEAYAGPPLRIMEVCGTHTHEIFRLGVRRILPPNIRLVSGPGCPVCVTPAGFIDEAAYLALERHAVICTFGDLVRVPGSEMSLAEARGRGAEVRIVYSPLDALTLAETMPIRALVRFSWFASSGTVSGSSIPLRSTTTGFFQPGRDIFPPEYAVPTIFGRAPPAASISVNSFMLPRLLMFHPRRTLPVRSFCSVLPFALRGQESPETSSA